MKTDIWMPIYVKDYMASTSRLTTEEHGAYLLLLFDYWVNGRLPNDINTLCQISKLNIDKKYMIEKILDKHFYYDKKTETFINERIESEKEKASTNRSSAKKNGKLGGRPRKEKNKYKYKESDWYEMVEFFEYKCLCCECEMSKDNQPTRDHIVAKSNGGQDDIRNFQPLCRECNSSKGGQDSTDYRIKFLNLIPGNLITKWFYNPKPVGFGNNKVKETSSPAPAPTSLTTTSSLQKPLGGICEMYCDNWLSKLVIKNSVKNLKDVTDEQRKEIKKQIGMINGTDIKPEDVLTVKEEVQDIINNVRNKNPKDGKLTDEEAAEAWKNL